MGSQFIAIVLLFAVAAGALAGPPQAGPGESCYTETRIAVPDPTSAKIAYVDNSTYFPKEYRDATVRATYTWPQHGDRILLIRFAASNDVDMPEVVFDRRIAPLIKDRGWVSHAKEKQIDRCLEHELKRIRDEFSAELTKTLVGYRASPNGRSPIAAALTEAGSLIASIPRGRVSILLLSDGLEHSAFPPRGVSFYQPGAGQQLRALEPEVEVSRLKELGLLPRLAGVKVWMSGVGLTEPGPDGQVTYRRPAADVALLKLTWTKIFAASGAEVIEINAASPLRKLE